MGGTDPGKCPLCEAELRTGEDVCPNCGTDTALFNLDEGLEDLEPRKESQSLDELLASVLGDSPSEKSTASAATSKPAKASEPSELDELDLDLDLPDEPARKPKLDLDILEEDVLGTRAEGKSQAPERPAPPPAKPGRETPPKPPSAPEPRPEPKPGMTFECPECHASVEEDASVCYSCGAIFAEGDIFPCPECRTNVPLDAGRCPGCGLRFVEEAPSRPARPAAPPARPRREPPAGMGPRPSSLAGPGTPPPSGELVKRILTKYRALEQSRTLEMETRADLPGALQTAVTELRSLLSLARSVRLPVEEVQRKVAEATRRARSRDLDGAVRLAHGARLALEQSVGLQLAKRMEMVEAELRASRTRGNAFGVAESLLAEGIRLLEQGQVEAAYERLQRAKEDMSSSVGGQTDARYALQTAQEMVREIGPLGVGTTELQDFLSHGTEALRQGNYETASQIAATVQERATEGLQERLAEEMRGAKELVLNRKLQGHDVTRPISLLKQASASVKDRNFEEALRYLKALRQELGG